MPNPDPALKVRGLPELKRLREEEALTAGAFKVGRKALPEVSARVVTQTTPCCFFCECSGAPATAFRQATPSSHAQGIKP